MSSATNPGEIARPDPNTYWVLEGRFLAGEYPGALDPAAAQKKVAAFLKTGVTTFIDLTEAGELASYAQWLPAGQVEHRRLPIRDLSVPKDARHMHDILDAIDTALAADRMVYVHCWGGIGRTGTVIACWLQRCQSLDPDAALQKLAGFWHTVAKRHRRNRSPETAEQFAWVRNWPQMMATLPSPANASIRADQSPLQSPIAPISHPTSATPPDLQNRFRGCLLGLACGDAVGTTVEFSAPGALPPVTDLLGGGPFGLKAGQWTDDTSMALCLADSLLACDGFDPVDQLRRYTRWAKQGERSSTGHCFDIGGTVSAALRRFAQTGEPACGSTDPRTAGNGSIMRLAPVPMRYFNDPARAMDLCAESSRTTHAAPTAVDACRYLGGLIVGALGGASKAELLSARYAPAPGYWEGHPLAPEIDAIAAGSFLQRQPPQIRGTGYVVQSLEAALWAFARSDSFREGCLLAVNLGEDADTTAAVYGQLAGAFYGEAGIPAEWLAKLTLREEIVALADQLRLVAEKAA